MNLKRFLQIFGAIAVVLSLFPLIAVDYWWVRIFDFPHVQLTLLTLVAFFVYFFRFDIKSWQDYAFVAIIAACFIFQFSKIYPLTPLADYQVLPNEQEDFDNTLSLMASNVYQENKKTGKLLDEILRLEPNFIVLTETNQRWIDEISPNLASRYPYKVEIPLENTYGMAVYSDYRLIDPEVKYLVDDSIPSIHGRMELASGAIINFISIHPTPPMPQHNPKSTERDAEMMIAAKMAKEADLPTIVTGDFNDVAWSNTTLLFIKNSKLLDPRVGRGLYNTFDANNWLMRWPLDHLFFSAEFRLVDLQLGNDVGSDHFPFYAKISLEPERAAMQQPEPPTEEEMEEANMHLEKERED